MEEIIIKQEIMEDEVPDPIIQIKLEVSSDEEAEIQEETEFRHSGAEPMDCGEEMLSCKECKEVFSAVDDWIFHTSRVHQNELKCRRCDKVLSKKSSLKRHEEVCTGSLNCTECASTFNSLSALQIHKKMHARKRRSSINIQFKCSFCYRVFDTEDKLEDHNRKCTGKTSYQCSVCNMAFSRMSDLTSHNIVHRKIKILPIGFNLRNQSFLVAENLIAQQKKAQEDELKCNVCCQTFIDKSVLEKHKEVCNSATPCFPCSDCNLQFTKLCSLMGHKKFHEFCKESITKKGSIECHLCNQTFSITKELWDHRKIHHANEDLKCRLCNVKFKNSCDLSFDKHQDHEIECNKIKLSKIVELPQGVQLPQGVHVVPNQLSVADFIARQIKQDLTCGVCRQIFSTMSALDKHRELCSKSIPCFPCSECDMIFTEIGILNEHKGLHVFYKKSLAKKVPMKCEQCGLTFSDTRKFIPHWKSHQVQEVLKCQLCDKEFKGRNYVQRLKDHEQVCKKRNSVSCSECNMTFPHENFLKLHKKVHVPKSSDALPSEPSPSSYSCNVCNEEFQDKEYLQAHSLIHQSEKTALDKPRELYNKSTRCFPCGECELKFTELAHLKKHTRLHVYYKKSLSKKVPMKCDQCGQTFSDTREFIAHWKSHQVQEVLKCQHCDKEFKGRNYVNRLKEHEQVCKKRNSVVTCNECNMNFDHENFLKLHKKVHVPKSASETLPSEASPASYSCNVCNEEFPDLEYLQAHSLIHQMNDS